MKTSGMIKKISGRTFRCMGEIGRSIFTCLQRIGDLFNNERAIYLVGKGITNEQINDVYQRLAFYVPDLSGEKIRVLSTWTLNSTFTLNPILILDSTNPLVSLMLKFRRGTFDINCRTNPKDGWSWADFVCFVSPNSIKRNLSKERFAQYIQELKQLKYNKCYLFGTGPSLELAQEKDWSDGYRLVCNTIVRDPDLWKHINPHFIVAGDAIYHFGHTAFAHAFRHDLALRLMETNTFFLYPVRFDPIVQREFFLFKDRLIPVPFGRKERIDFDLTVRFQLPSMGNVLPQLLLPLGCTLSKNIYFWGFDGRAPDDKLFWSNSRKHSYPEFIPELINAHPAFFDHYVPTNNPSYYSNLVHGDKLERSLVQGEKAGFKFIMMHKSWTPTLQKRNIQF